MILVEIKMKTLEITNQPAKITFYVPHSLDEKARLHSAITRKSLSAIATDALTIYFHLTSNDPKLLESLLNNSQETSIG
jgi:hypothetical protein